MASRASKQESAKLNGYGLFVARCFYSRTTDGCIHQWLECRLECFTQQAQRGFGRGGTEDAPGCLMGALCRDSLGKWERNGPFVVLHRYFNAKFAEERLSRVLPLNLDMYTGRTPATWLILGVLDSRDVMDLSWLDLACDDGSGSSAAGSTSREKREQYGKCAKPRDASRHVLEDPLTAGHSRVASRGTSRVRPRFARWKTKGPQAPEGAWSPCSALLGCSSGRREPWSYRAGRAPAPPAS